MKDKYVVHTPNKKNPDTIGGCVRRFNDWYFPEYDNTDRLTIVGIPNETTKELSIGVSFCCYPDNFSRVVGTVTATSKASGFPYTKPYAIIQLEESEFTQETCLQYLYDLHAELVSKSVKEVKKLVNQQIVK